MKAIEFNGVETTGFLKKFVVLMQLFTFVVFEVLLLEKNNLIAVKKLIETRKVFTGKAHLYSTVKLIYTEFAAFIFFM